MGTSENGTTAWTYFPVSKGVDDHRASPQGLILRQPMPLVGQYLGCVGGMVGCVKIITNKNIQVRVVTINATDIDPFRAALIERVLIGGVRIAGMDRCLSRPFNPYRSTQDHDGNEGQANCSGHSFHVQGSVKK
ncbi:MAG: hypothetical protein DRH12_18575 [Deltaproteobacteria bacterium]|nr:MAG: hypothetical protein DRH12_18575 [Deltaproteobacteria bacterium]